MLVAVAFIALEAGHTHAHQQLSGHESASAHESPAPSPSVAEPLLADHHGHEAHAHLTMMPTTTAKSLALDLPVVVSHDPPRLYVRSTTAPPSASIFSRPPGLLEHGPPPPSRAPPHV